MLSKITKTDYNKCFQVYEFDTILGKSTISKSWRGMFILQTSAKGEHKDENFEVVYFWCADLAYKKLIDLCDAEVERVNKYIIKGE